jgi:hypothetical protein
VGRGAAMTAYGSLDLILKQEILILILMSWALERWLITLKVCVCGRGDGGREGLNGLASRKWRNLLASSVLINALKKGSVKEIWKG